MDLGYMLCIYLILMVNKIKINVKIKNVRLIFDIVFICFNRKDYLLFVIGQGLFVYLIKRMWFSNMYYMYVCFIVFIVYMCIIYGG